MQKATAIWTFFALLFGGLVGFALAPKIIGKPAGGSAIRVKHAHVAKDCKQSDCDVKISFACDPPTPPSPATCEPYGNPELIKVDTGHKIKFVIDNPSGADYRFHDGDGIKFESTYFTCEIKDSGKGYECKVDIPDHPDIDFYKYSVQIVGFDVVDPWVVNYKVQ